MSELRSEDWSVRPSFVPHGPTSPVALLIDDATFTQLAGIPPVAWQTPWHELGNVELVRFSHHMALFATVGDVRYCWRHRELTDFEALRAVVLEHGGLVTRQRRRVGVFVVVGFVVLASFAGAIAAWFTRSNPEAQELNALKSVNLTLKDLPSGWYPSSSSILSYLVPPGGVVYPSTTTTTAPPTNSSFDKAAALFQACLGVSNAKDRVYGAAGQMPDYQVSSSIFNSNSLGGIELATTAQYYHTTSMVRRDTAEMTMTNFGSCFVASSASMILAGYGLTNPATNVARNWRPRTFLHGWSRGGVVAISVPGVTSNLHLVMVVVTQGHYEVTVSALVGSFTKTKGFLTNVVNTLLSRMSSPTSLAA